MSSSSSSRSSVIYYCLSIVISALGALGVALQNYLAVEIFLKGLLSGGKWVSGFIKSVSIGSGGIASGMVNFWMNVSLLEGFFARMTSNKDYHYKTLSTLEKVQYFGGIFVFVVTGILFGLMAFAFGLEGPISILAVAAGVFVSMIMTIQEVETWLKSYNPLKIEEEALSGLQKLGKACGHIIAIGNVLALSLLFTLGLAESLMMMQIAAFPAFVIGVAVAFTFGAFTEYYFYNFYLADFCKDFYKNCQLMRANNHPVLGLLCVSTNAFVNAALTYSGVGLLTGLLVTAGIGLPSIAVITGLSVVSAFFSGSASFVLGMDFWIGERPDNSPACLPVEVDVEVVSSLSHGKSAVNDVGLILTPGLSIFNRSPLVDNVVSNHLSSASTPQGLMS